VLLIPTRGAAQGAAQVQSFDDLGLRINLGDELQVNDQSGLRTRGRLIRLTRGEIVLQTDAGEKRFTSDSVREVALRSHSLRRTALIGAGVFAILGVVATCAHERGDNCVLVGSLGAAPIGAGAGLAAGALLPRMRTIYRAPPQTRAPDAASRADGQVQGTMLEELALRVNLDDQLQVEDQSGARVTGRLVHLTADEMTLLTDAGERRFRRELVRHVAVRRRPLRQAVLAGAGVGAAAGAIAACTGSSREECVDAPIMAGALGAGVGLAVGALLHTTTVVYPETRPRTMVAPLISRDVVGVRVDLRW
jgi:hypothetical protein